MARVPWESWVYTQIGGGIELVFTDQVMSGRWGFAPLPLVLDLKLLSRLAELDPGSVFQKVSSEMPEHFHIPPGMTHLDFYYDLASFRGEDGQTVVEVYLGIPPAQIAFGQEGREKALVERSVALAEQDGEAVHTVRDQLGFREDVPSAQRGLFVDVAWLNVPPGAYRLAVKLADRVSGKWGVYVQEVDVPAFGDSLAMSDLEMAATVSDDPWLDKFRKGNVWVVPAPTRSYPAHRSAYLYYEVYNLKEDEFGLTRYEVTYTVRPDVRKKTGLFGALTTGLKRLASREKAEVVIRYERSGIETTEPVYFELDRQHLGSGLKQIEVRITDLIGGGSVSKEAIFQLEGEKPRVGGKAMGGGGNEK